jgi:hypothetical protein
MKSFKKALKLSGLIILIVLASFGIGLTGGVPIPRSNKKEDNIEINVKLPDDDEDEARLTQFNIKS